MFRKPSFFCLLLASTLGATAPSGHAAAPVQTEPSDMDPQLLAKIAKAEARQQVGSQIGTISPGGEMVVGGAMTAPGGCGNVNIGNVAAGPTGFLGPRDITVIVTGDVVNAGNTCKR